MSELRPYLAEVGLPSSKHPQSITGISSRFSSYVDGFSPQRLVILEPKAPRNRYAQDYEAYLEELHNSSVRVEFVDIYHQAPSFWKNLSCAFLGLENVLNDPNYAGKKNLNAFAKNTAQILVPGSFGFVYDEIPVPGNLYIYESFKKELKRVGLRVVIDDMTPKDFKDTKAYIEKSSQIWNDRMDLLAIGLARLNSLDKPLTDALLARCRGHWLVFQKER